MTPENIDLVVVTVFEFPSIVNFQLRTYRQANTVKLSGVEPPGVRYVSDNLRFSSTAARRGGFNASGSFRSKTIRSDEFQPEFQSLRHVKAAKSRFRSEFNMHHCLRIGMTAIFLSAATLASAKAPEGAWTPLDVMPPAVQAQAAWIRPSVFKAAQLDDVAMRRELAAVPMETFPLPPNEGVLFRIPHPQGGFATFRVVESPVMEQGLMDRFPEIRTYRGQGVDEPAATLRFDLTPQGFHAMVLSPEGDYFIDPYSRGDINHYAVYYKHDYLRQASDDFACGVTGELIADISPYGERNSGTVLKTYRTAVAATGEYTTFQGGTVALGQAAIVTAVNRVTGVYERELCVRLVLVANNSNLVYTNASTDPYTNNNGSTMLGQNQTNVDAVIGSANYDIGHVFSTGGGGVALLGCVCRAGSKAQGVTGLGSPTGDPFYIDYVAHEMGHEFGGNHTFNGTGGSCAGNRASSAAYEPGSASTIMGYAGICGAADDLQAHSDAFFHHQSYAEIRAYIAGSGSCGANSNTGNTVPTVNGGTDYTIPKGTAFTLTTSSATDANGDSLTYSWEERDLGAANNATTADNGTSPIMRAWAPTTSNARTFPRLSSVLSGSLPIGEQYPVMARTFHARVSVRDNRSGGGGVIEDDVIVNINGTAGPFAVTSPNTAVTWSGTQTVTWNVAGTNAAPVSTSLVNILLSSDGGLTWPYTLAANTPNDGSETVAMPAILSSTCRVKVEAVGNIYFDVSNTNFTVQGITLPATPTSVSASPGSLCTGSSPVTLTAVVGAGEIVDWNSGSCGGALVGSGSPLSVSPAVTTTYYARARNIANGNVSAACASATVTVLGGAPAAPATMSATDSTTCLGVTVIWAAASGATGYQILRSETNDVSTATQIAAPAASPYSDTASVPGITYFYWIRSVGGCGASQPAGPDVGTRKAVPASVGSPAATSSNCGSVSITWVNVAAATGYQIFRNTANDAATATQVAAASTSPVIDSPPSNTPYFYWIRGSNSCGTSALAPAGIGMALASPATPSGLVASDSSTCDGVSVSWTASPGAATYSLYRAATSDQASASLLANTAVSSYLDTSAAAGHTYYYWVSAGNACGQSAMGGPDSGSKQVIPPTPTGIAASDATSCNGVVVTWTASPGGSSYAVLRNVGNTPVGATELATTALTSFDDSTAPAGQTLYYFVQAISACGRSSASIGDAGVRGTSPSIAQQPTDVTASEGASVSFTVLASGTDAAHYQWRKGGSPLANDPPHITGTDTASLSISSVVAADAGAYDAVATSTCGQATSSPAQLVITSSQPCPADFNNDGGVDGADIDAFFVAWEAGEASADVNQDGGVDGVDVATFFTAWEAGGC